MNKFRSTALLLGPLASGKTTLAKAVAVRDNIVAIEVGSLLKVCARRNSELGNQLKPHILSREFPHITYKQSGALPVPQVAERMTRWLDRDSPDSSGIAH